jgi:preprotein translocase subunit YajC
MPSSVIQIGGIILIFVIMYMLMIRPQRKRQKQVDEMRSQLKAGDYITTIGGIKGKVMTVKDDLIVIQVGADKVKLEVMRWAISKVDAGGSTASKSTSAKKSENNKEESAEEETKPVRKPRKLSAKADKTEDEDSGKE